MFGNLRRGVAAIGVAMLSATLLVAAPAPAQAASFNGVCDSGEFCLYYNSNNQGSLIDFPYSIKTYGTGSGCYKYLSAGAGKGQCVKNNAASAWNRESAPVTVFYKSNWSGAIDNFTPNAKANLRPYLKNDNAGHVVGWSSNQRLEIGIYHTASARITAYFDGYESTPGRHEGIDLTWFDGAGVFSPIAGTVINRVDGRPGSTQGDGLLSTLSIYNSTLDKTVIFLHLKPRVNVGDVISGGQAIGYEDNRGAVASHTHVEMRDGWEKKAAPSYNDYTLSNPIPTLWWMQRGYNICCQFS